MTLPLELAVTALKIRTAVRPVMLAREGCPAILVIPVDILEELLERLVHTGMGWSRSVYTTAL